MLSEKVPFQVAKEYMQHTGAHERGTLGAGHAALECREVGILAEFRHELYLPDQSDHNEIFLPGTRTQKQVKSEKPDCSEVPGSTTMLCAL